MPRIKAVPLNITKRVASDVPLIDDSEPQPETSSTPTSAKRKKKGNKKEYEFIVDTQFEEFLSDANFYLTVKYIDKSEDDWTPSVCHCLLGSFSVKITANDSIDGNFDINSINRQSLYIYVKQEPFKAFVYYDCNETKTGKHFPIELKSHFQEPIPLDFVESLNCSQIFLTTDLVFDANNISVDVWLLKNGVKKVFYHSQAFAPNKQILCLMNFLYDFPLPTEPPNNDISNESVEELYSKIKAKHLENKHNIPSIDVQHPALLPTLRDYQIEAVQWMLKRENNEEISEHQSVYQQIETRDGKTVHYNKYLGHFIDERSLPMNLIYGIPQSGILADEMGLGKTIEVLSCILCNPKPTNDYSIENYYAIDKRIDHNYEEECFACVCGEISDVNAYRRRKAIVIDYEYNNLVDIKEHDSDTEIDEDIEEESIEDEETRKQIIKRMTEQNVRKIVIHKFVNKKPVVKMYERNNRRVIAIKKKKVRSRMIVQCRGCGSYQHSTCVNYDINKRQPYFCGHCWVKEGMTPVESRATLIVSPRSISHQWAEEITKHMNCSGLNIYIYEGVKSSKGYIQPFDLADNDIVLTTYETFRSEIDFVDLHHSDRFRYPKRFNSTPSPLIAVNWWRICLDEAQMVESASAKTAKMAHTLYGKHRWCITGTPIQRSINDIYGLLYFIGEEPFHERLYWESMLFWPYAYGNTKPMVTALSHCFWRTSKKDVWEQLGIPIQTTTMKALKFSPIERHFYLRQHSECQRKFNEKMIRFSDLNIRLKELDKTTANKVMTPLLSLRQACCHPQAVRGKFLPISKKTLTMDELLNTMIKNTQYECEDEHRKIISSYNGIAGIHIIQEDYEKAIDFYRKALNSIENYMVKDLFRTDKLQKYHTLHNLAEILEKCGVKQKDKDSDEYYNKENEESKTSIAISVEFGHTLRDEYLKYESLQIHNEYLAKGTTAINEVTKQLHPIIENVEQILDSFNSPVQKPWWNAAIVFLRSNDEEYTLITRVRDALESHSLRGTLGEEQLSKFVSISTKFRDSSGLIYVLDKCLQELHKSRDALKEAIKKLRPKPSQTELNQAIDCHLRPIRDKEGNRAESVVKCKYCLIHEMFNDYEMKLYYFSAEEKTEESACKSSALMEKQRRGNWGDSETEQCLKVINQMFRIKANHSFPQHKLILEDGKIHLKLFESLKKEFKGLRAVWIETFDFVSQIDELNMATIRFRLRFKDEPKPEETVTYILDPHEVSLQYETLKSDEVIAKNALAKKLSHLYYLNNLAKDDSSRKGGRNLELCPICQYSMGEQWSVLQCGHSLCIKCLDIVISQYSRNSGNTLTIQCALCREVCPVSAILYVNSIEDEEIANQIEVKGSWSTKIEEVVRCLIKIMSDEPNAKTLVFSTWADVLLLISNALQENKINHIFIKHSTKFGENIDNFKQNKDIKALLMPMDLGAKGLNLIEATHVILVEPTLNRANEQQAVGRVHRIGQTKPTFVHRFIVNDTIEERIYYSYSGETRNDSSGPLQLAETSEHAFLTLNQMKQLFDNK